MIAFDNGPAGGDYVRYIDDLMKRAAVAASAGTLGDGGASAAATARTRSAAVDGPQRPSQAARTLERTTTPVAASGWAPAATDIARRSTAESGQTTGFVAPTASARSASAAAAIASALMSGEVGARAALSTHAKVGLAAIAFGVVLIAVGLFWVPLNAIFLIAGVAVIVWAVRMMRDAKTSLLVRPTGGG